MQTFIKRIVCTLAALLVFVGHAAAADEVRFEAKAPLHATAGKAVKVSFTLNAEADRGTFVAPSFETFDVIAGPTTSTGHQTQIINGQVSSSTTYTITYIIIPQSKGIYTIGSAKISSGGKQYSTRPIKIEVAAEGSGVGSNSQQKKQSGQERANNSIAKDDVLLRWQLSSTSVYKGEALRATLKLYTRVSIVGNENWKLPSFDGFWKQELKANEGPSRQTINDKVYEVYDVADFLLYPQQSGMLTIEPAEATVIIQVQVESDNSNIDPFFGSFGGFEFYNVKRTLRTPNLKVDVRELPAGAPASFAGAVGDYTIDQSLSSNELKANSSATFTIRINGHGNINFIQAPQLQLPASFELYEVKSSEKVKNTISGSRGYKQFEYPFVVRSEGDYTIPSVEFSFFSTTQGRYVTLATAPVGIVVTPDGKSTSNTSDGTTTVRSEGVRHLADDIRFIKLDDAELRSNIAPLVLSPLYFAILFAIALAAVLTYILVRRHIRNKSNIVLVRGRRANKVAVQRFRKAAKYMREEDRRAFYQEMLLALWGYLGDRFNIPVAELTKESVREELTRRGAEAEAERIIDIITRCEEAQYSPIVSATMNDVYSDGLEIVSHIESAIKR